MCNLRPLNELKKANISIQGSEYHYSTPRIYLDNIADYEALEIALFTKNNVWINPRTSLVMKPYPKLSKLLEYYEKESDPVGCQVPTDLVLDLVKWLDKN